MTKLRASILSAIVVAGAATSVVVFQQARAKLREQDESLRQQSVQLGQLADDNERLSIRASRATNSTDQLADLLRLRAEAESLRRQTSDLARLREEARRRQPQADAQPKTSLQIKEERIAKMNFCKDWLIAFILYYYEHHDQFPTNFAQAAAFFEPRDAQSETNVSVEQFEVVCWGSRIGVGADASAVVGIPLEAIALREKTPWQDSDGKWCKIYGFADGMVQTIAMPSRWKNLDGIETRYDTFEAYEKDHIIAPPE